MPAASFKVVMQVAASMELSATRRFKAEFSAGDSAGGFVTARVIAYLEYRRAHSRVQPRNAKSVRLPIAFGIPNPAHHLNQFRRSREGAH